MNSSNKSGSSVSASEKQKILLIDDEKGVARALSLLLEAIGYSADTFTLPAQAIAHLENFSKSKMNIPYQLVLSDLRMPDHSGIDVLIFCKSHLHDLPVVIMSGHASEDEKKLAFELGCAGFLSKPFSPDQLQAIIQNIQSLKKAS